MTVVTFPPHNSVPHGRSVVGRRGRSAFTCEHIEHFPKQRVRIEVFRRKKEKQGSPAWQPESIGRPWGHDVIHTRQWQREKKRNVANGRTKPRAVLSDIFKLTSRNSMRTFIFWESVRGLLYPFREQQFKTTRDGVEDKRRRCSLRVQRVFRRVTGKENVQFQLGGGSPMGFHVVNMIFSCFSTVPDECVLSWSHVMITTELKMYVVHSATAGGIVEYIFIWGVRRVCSRGVRKFHGTPLDRAKHKKKNFGKSFTIIELYCNCIIVYERQVTTASPSMKFHEFFISSIMVL